MTSPGRKWVSLHNQQLPRINILTYLQLVPPKSSRTLCWSWDNTKKLEKSAGQDSAQKATPSMASKYESSGKYATSLSLVEPLSVLVLAQVYEKMFGKSETSMYSKELEHLDWKWSDKLANVETLLANTLQKPTDLPTFTAIRSTPVHPPLVGIFSEKQFTPPARQTYQTYTDQTPASQKQSLPSMLVTRLTL